MAIIPIATRWNYETEQLDAVLSPEDYQKVKDGYGCSVCLADYNGIWQATCPTCGNRTPSSSTCIRTTLRSRSPGVTTDCRAEVGLRHSTS